jgi:hypothetical protein
MNSAATNKEVSEQVSFSNEQLDDEQADLDNILDNISIPASIIQFMCEEKKGNSASRLNSTHYNSKKRSSPALRLLLRLQHAYSESPFALKQMSV